MTLINYVARIHFAEQAIEDALPEEIGGAASGMFCSGRTKPMRLVR